MTDHITIKENKKTMKVSELPVPNHLDMWEDIWIFLFFLFYCVCVCVGGGGGGGGEGGGACQ